MHALIHLFFSRGEASTLLLYILLLSDIIAIAQVPAVLLHRRGRPVAALSWLLAIFTLPWIGILMWWFLGRTRLQRKMRRRKQRSQEFCACLPEGVHLASQEVLSQFQGLLPQSITTEQQRAPFSLSQKNQVQLLVDGEQAFSAMEQAVSLAQHYIHLLFYIWKADQTGTRIRDLLIQKVQEGLEVRLLIDAWGQPKHARNFFAPLQQAGGHVAYFLPIRLFSQPFTLNFRNHRKLMIIDGVTAFTGGMNISDEYQSQWRDTAIKITGPATVQLHEVFLEDWFFATHQNLASSGYLTPKTSQESTPKEETKTIDEVACAIIPSGPDGRTNWCHDTLFLALSSAKHRIYLTTPYFIPSAPIIAALRGAAQRGLDVKIVLPQKNDQPLVRIASHTYYETLLNAGVKIYEFEPSVLHAKTLVIDDNISVLGSANVDIRSFRLNFEISCIFLSKQLARQLVDSFHKDLNNSREITQQNIGQLHQPYSWLESAAHLLSPLL